MRHAGFAPKAPAVPLHFLLKRYATANNPAIANTPPNPGSSGASAAGTDVGVAVGLVIWVGVAVGVTVKVGAIGGVVGEVATVGVGAGVGGVGMYFSNHSKILRFLSTACSFNPWPPLG